MPNRSASTVPCVPLPEPGGPINSSFMHSPFHWVARRRHGGPGPPGPGPGGPAHGSQGKDRTGAKGGLIGAPAGRAPRRRH